jgi:UDP-N-acetylglucosamine 2-epimerase (non-hydrolysing)
VRTTIACIVGTRPEAIKMAPVILALREQPWADVVVIATAQHRALADDVFDLFGITPDLDLDLMQPGQTLSALTARAVLALDRALSEIAPGLVLAQGDTTSVMAVALTCFYRQVPFAHVEAGLRSFHLQNPFPEEFNRIAASRLATLHFAPTEQARTNLRNEGVSDCRIVVTGNTVIDALFWVAARNLALPIRIDPGRRLLLVTVHRRENLGEPLRTICRAVLALVAEFPDTEVLWPLHPNPNVVEVVQSMLAGTPRIHLTRPLRYGEFATALKQAFFILTDSGGVQEEAPALARPVLVLRRETERPETIRAGAARLVGTDFEDIMRHARELLDDPEAYRVMAQPGSLYGDGAASGRIVRAIEQALTSGLARVGRYDAPGSG